MEGHSMLRKLFHRLCASLRRGKIENELERELRFHLEMEVAENMRRGMSEEEARRAARISFGGVEQTKESYRDIARFRWIEDLWQDLHYGARMLLKNPGFTIIAVLALALGIGANTAIFSVVNWLMFQQLPVKEPRALIYLGFDQGGPLQNDSQFSFPEYRQITEESGAVFDG